MATEKETLSGSLRQQLDEQKMRSQAKYSPEEAAIMQGTREELVRSGIAQRSLREGAKAPDFRRPNVRGEAVKLADLLAHGPVVVAFYRGAW